MYLYEQPELLTKEDHGHLGLSKLANRFGFASAIRMVPVVFSELSSVQKHYPVVYSELENPFPVAVLGVLEDVNLFVDAEGAWDPSCYVPSYLRRYPFAVVHRAEEQFAVIIDRAAQAISENPEFPFFDGDELTENTQAITDFCSKYEADRRRTVDFCARLKELDLLVAQQAGYRPDGAQAEESLAQYVTVDVDRLNELDTDVLRTLHRNGSLASIYAQAFSQENWNRLLDRRARLQQEA
jgi:hypothetical protein